MKKLNIKIISPLLCCVPMAGFAETDYIPVPYEEWEVLDDVYTENDQQNVHFFMGLDAPLVTYENEKLSYKGAPFTIKFSQTNINYDIFDSMALRFGIQTDSGFRFSLLINHHNETQSVSNVSVETSQTEFYALLDVPLIKTLVTQPFLELGIGYGIINNRNYEGADIDGLIFNIGVGITHNFSDHIFGTITARYAFAPNMDVDNVDADVSYRGDVLGISFGLGYKF